MWEGEILGVIGRNGAGKSTLLKILSRITAPTSGRALIKGRVGSLLEVGTGFHPELTGRENIYLNGTILGMTRAEVDRKLEEIVEFAEIAPFIDTPVKRYSSGMTVRLAFAVAAHLEPEILIVDEVLAVGDIQFQKKCLGKMSDVGKKGRTVIFVSHNLAAINQLCSTAILLHGGKILINCNSAEAVSYYMKQSVAMEGRKDWQNGVGDEIRLLSVELTDDNGQSKSQFLSSENVHIIIECVVCRRVDSARVGFRLNTVDGVTIFTSEDSDTLGYINYRNHGSYAVKAVIPKDFLNEGSYFITVGCHVPMVQIIFLEENVLCFSVKSINGIGGFVDDKRKGIIRPKLEWNIIRNN